MTRRRVLAVVGLVLALAGLTVALVGPGRGSRAATPALAGPALFAAKGCASCHDGPDSMSPIGAGPPLSNAPAWAGTRRPGFDAAAYLAESMRDPGAFVSPAHTGQAVMPVLTLDDDEIDRLVAYLLDR